MLIFVPLAFTGTLLAQDPFAGTWKLDPSQSSGDDIPKAETMVIADYGGNVHVTISGTDADGTPIAVTYVVPTAGGDGQVTQGPYDSVSEQQVDNNTRDVAYGKKGNDSESHEVISKNGKTMKATKKHKDAKGNTVSSTEVYQKTSDTQNSQ
jgi:hypothetical protein